MKPKYDDNVKLCYMDTDSFIFHAKTEDFYKDIADDIEKLIHQFMSATPLRLIDHYL